MCFTGTISIIAENGQSVKITVIECLLKNDPSFWEQYSISLFGATGAGITSLWFIILLPLLDSIPALFSFADTFSGFWRMEYIRKSKRFYRIKKFITICLSGAIPAVLGYMIFVLTLIPFVPYGYDITTTDENGEQIVFNTGAPIEEFISTTALNTLTLFLIGIITSAICLTLYILLKNRYKSVGIPLIIYYLSYAVSLALYTKHISDFRLLVFSPYFVVTTGKSIMEAMEVPYALLFVGLGLIIGIFYLIYHFLLKRRLEQ